MKEVRLEQHIKVLGISLLVGVAGLILVSMSGGLVGRDQFTIPALALFLFMASLFGGKSYPSSKWLVGVGVALPILVLAAIFARAESWRYSLMCSTGLLAASWLGAYTGFRLTKVSRSRQITVSIVTGILTIIGIVALTYLSYQPSPLPAEQSAYLGRWTSDRGIDITISPDGLCALEYSCPAREANLGSIDIPDVPGGSDDLQIAVHDSLMQLFHPMHFSCLVKVNQPPREDSGYTRMVIEGIVFTRVS